MREVPARRITGQCFGHATYGLCTKSPNPPADFAFRLKREEVAGLRSQNATSSSANLTNRSQFATGLKVSARARSQIATLKSPASSNLRSQIVISKGRGGRRYPPYAFTQHDPIIRDKSENNTTYRQSTRVQTFSFAKLRQRGL